MIRPILACIDPYKTVEDFASAGWNIDFSQPPESGDPLVGVSLCENSVLLGVTEGYVSDEQIFHVGCGVEIYMTVPLMKSRRSMIDTGFFIPQSWLLSLGATLRLRSRLVGISL